jgi:hypothetical protein
MSDKRMATSEWPPELSLDGGGGPAPYITRAKADALIFAALEQAGFDTAVPVPAPVPTRELRNGWAARSVAAVVLFASLGVGSASAAVMWYVRERTEAPAPAPVLERQQEREAVRRAPARVEAKHVAPLELPAEIIEPKKVERRAPEDWLVEGNRLRAERRWDKADEAYGQAVRSAPHGPSAYVARVASAAVRLEHLHDARGALSLYRAALREQPQGSLREEVLFGIAEAQRALGNREAERAALEHFLREYPSSPLAGQAKSRLD